MFLLWASSDPGCVQNWGQNEGDDGQRGLLRHAGAQRGRLHVHLGEQHERRGQYPQLMGIFHITSVGLLSSEPPQDEEKMEFVN